MSWFKKTPQWAEWDIKNLIFQENRYIREQIAQLYLQNHGLKEELVKQRKQIGLLENSKHEIKPFRTTNKEDQRRIREKRK